MKNRLDKAIALTCAGVLTILLAACRGGPGGKVSANASAMRLTSGYTGIVMNASKVPGYWATRVGDGEKFFLYTLEGSFRKGEVILVDGAFGSASVAFFDEETRVYQSGARTNVFIVQRAAKTDPEKYGRGTPGEDRP
jgi:hypothetical protein